MSLWYKFIGLIEWAITFVNHKGNISHSKQGMTMFGFGKEFDSMSKKEREKLMLFLSESYGWDDDEAYAYSIWIMECVDEEE